MLHSLTPRALALVATMFLGWQTPALAQSGISLDVSVAGAPSASVAFDLADLDAMEQVTFQTTTLWTDGVVTFSGVPLRAVLDAVGGDGTAVEMVALNDYKVVMPLADIDETAPIIATRMDGDTMSVRDKGPYWVVFPYDQGPQYQTETIYSFSIWQLNRLKIVD